MRHNWSEPVKGKDKWVQTCVCGCRKVTVKLHTAAQRNYIHYEVNGERRSTAPLCSGPVNQGALFQQQTNAAA